MHKNYILFDCDGVLVDSEWIASNVLSQMLQVYNCPTSADEIMTHYVGQKDVEIVDILTQKHSLSVPTNFMDLYASELDQEIAKKLRPVVGIESTLQSLHMNRAIVSNSTLARIEISLNSTGLNKYFDPSLIFSPDLCNYSKPDPRLYQFAVDNLGLDQKQVLVIEDSPTGVEAASKAGLDVVGFLGATSSAHTEASLLRLKGAKYIAHNSLELSQLIHDICG